MSFKIVRKEKVTPVHDLLVIVSCVVLFQIFVLPFGHIIKSIGGSVSILYCMLPVFLIFAWMFCSRRIVKDVI
ncbi:MAG: hypothetical protein DRM99_00880 [Thermoplasmata archaeon]|nr:MAG: hypothetical protein DRM99_00880 [Thermoplasmata archaeon]